MTDKSPDESELSLSAMRRVDEACVEFEKRWRTGDRPQIEDFVTDVRGDERQILIRELILLDLNYRYKSDEPPNPKEYKQFFPNNESVINDAFDHHNQEMQKAVDAETSSGRDFGEGHAIRLKCPHCSNRIVLVDRAPLEITCNNCGSSFRIDRSTSQAGTSEIPQAIGRFQVLELLGRGAFGSVYKAYDPKLDVDLAIKVPRSGYFGTSEEEKRFLREARSAAQLSHPNIVHVNDVGTQNGLPFIVCEFIEGQTLAERIKEGLPPFRETAELIAGVADALRYAHSQKVIHRDIKPGNILIDKTGNPFVADFGLARRDEGEITVTVEGQILGTPAYMSPEQTRGDQAAIDARSDVYSLGVVLYEMLTGELPFRGNRRMLMQQVLFDEPVCPRNLNSQIPRDLEVICLKAISKEPSRRYEGARAFREDLQRWLKGETIHARPIRQTERIWRWCRRKPALASVIGLAAMLMIGITISATLIAFQQSEIAVQQSEFANKQASFSEEQIRLKAIADARAVRAERAERKSAWREYVGKIKLVQTEWDHGDVGVAWDALTNCRWDLRGWEHDYLYSRFKPHQLDLSVRTVVDGSAAFSPDGKRIVACGGPFPRSETGKIKVWDATSGEEILSVDVHTYVGSVAYSPDGKRIVSGSGDRKKGTINVWNATTGDELLSFDGHSERVSSVAFSPDGKRIVSGSGGVDMEKLASVGTVKVWNANNGKEALSLQGNTGVAESVSFSPDGKWIASGGDQKGKGTIHIWNADNGDKTFMFKSHGQRVHCVSFSPDSRWIVSGGSDSTIKVWNVTSGEEIVSLAGHRFSISSVAFSPDGKRIVSGSADDTIKVWNATSGEEIRCLKGGVDWIGSVAFSPNGEQIVSGGDGKIKVWTATNGEEKFLYKGGGLESLLTSVAYSHDGKRIVSGCAAIGNGVVEGIVTVWNSENGEEILKLVGHKDVVTGVAFSPDGSRIVSSGGAMPTRIVTAEDVKNKFKDFAGTIKVWNAISGKEILALKGHSAYVASVAFSPDGKRIVSGSWDETIRVWNATNGEETLTLKGHDEPVNSVAFSPDGKRIVSGSRDNTIRVWDATSGVEIIAIEGHAIGNVTFSPDSKRIVGGGPDNTIKVWNSENGQEIITLIGHQNSPICVAFSPDGRQIVSGGGDIRQGTIKIWSAISGEETLTLKGHSESVISVAFSPDGKRIVSGSFDNTIKVWNGHKSQEFSREIADEMNNRVWQIVRNAIEEDAAVPLALKDAEFVCRHYPDGNYLNTLGVAQFRSGQFGDAIETLNQSLPLVQKTMSLSSPHPLHLAFLAMSHFQLEQMDQANQFRDQLNESVRLNQFKSDPELTAFLGEVRRLFDESVK